MNIILIGMPGSGKSTCGVLAAKLMCKSFIDTDLLIQQNENMKLQEIIKTKGAEYFAEREEEAVCSLYTKNCIIATGGSVVYSEKAMNYFKSIGKVVYLHISYNNMRKRIKNLRSRGILIKDGHTLRDMYNERLPLYKNYADYVIDCNNLKIEATVEKIIKTFE